MSVAVEGFLEILSVKFARQFHNTPFHCQITIGSSPFFACEKFANLDNAGAVSHDVIPGSRLSNVGSDRILFRINSSKRPRASCDIHANQFSQKFTLASLDSALQVTDLSRALSPTPAPFPARVCSSRNVRLTLTVMALTRARSAPRFRRRWLAGWAMYCKGIE